MNPLGSPFGVPIQVDPLGTMFGRSPLTDRGSMQLPSVSQLVVCFAARFTDCCSPGLRGRRHRSCPLPWPTLKWTWKQMKHSNLLLHQALRQMTAVEAKASRDRKVVLLHEF